MGQFRRHATQRPFPDQATALARAVLLIERLAASRGGIGHLSVDRAERPAIQLPLIRASILGRLRTMLPRTPECVRKPLMPVLALIETEWPDSFRTAIGPS